MAPRRAAHVMAAGPSGREPLVVSIEAASFLDLYDIAFLIIGSMLVINAGVGFGRSSRRTTRSRRSRRGWRSERASSATATTTAFSKLKAGLEDAIAYHRGDRQLMVRDVELKPPAPMRLNWPGGRFHQEQILTESCRESCRFRLSRVDSCGCSRSRKPSGSFGSVVVSPACQSGRQGLRIRRPEVQIL